MANFTKIFFAILAVLLVLQSRVVDVDGRHIRSELSREFHKHGQHKHRVNNSNGHFGSTNSGVHVKRSATRRFQYEVDDFRPTSPGHSPGVGHSINN